MMRFLKLLALAALFVALGAGPSVAGRTFAVTVESNLVAEGVRAREGEKLPHKDGGQPVITVFVLFGKKFHGTLYVRGFRDDGMEIARSGFVKVSEPAESGGHIRFAFDPDTRLGEIHSYILTGNRTQVAPGEESFGEAAKNIVKELLQ